MRRTLLSLSAHAEKPERDPGIKPPSFISEIKPQSLRKFSARERTNRLHRKYFSKLDHYELNADNGNFAFHKRNLELNQAKYWSPPSLRTDGRAAPVVASESVCVDTYFEQTTGDASFIASPYWFRLKNRRDFYTFDDFAAVLLVETYWANQLAKLVSSPADPLFRRTGWSNWSRLSAGKASEGGLNAAELDAGQKLNEVVVASSSEDAELVALKRPFRQRFFALFAAITGDYNFDELTKDIVQDRVKELKVGLKLWLNPNLLLKVAGQSVPNTAEALKSLVPAGKLTRTGFLPRALQFLSFGGVYQYQFPLPYNLAGKLQLHPNIRRALQDQHFLDLSNFGFVFHTHAAWNPLNERRVGAAGNGYAADQLYGAPNRGTSVTYPGFESETRVASVNATISSLWTWLLRRTFYHVRPENQGDIHLRTTEGLDIYRRRDSVPFGEINLSLFKRRTFRQLHPSADAVEASRIWALRPRQRPVDLSEDLLGSASGLESYFLNVDRAHSDFAAHVVKA